MLTRLNWEPLASRRHAARLLMFYKIHYGLVATPVPLDIKLHPVPTRVENSLLWLTTSHRHHVTITFILFPRTVRDWGILPEAVVRASSPEVSQYSTVVLTVVRVMIAKYRKSGIWGYRSSLTPEPIELK